MKKAIITIAGILAALLAAYIALKCIAQYDVEIKQLKRDVYILQRQSDLHNEALHVAESEKKKIGEEYDKKREEIQKVIDDNDIFNLILPDDLLRLLKENTDRAANVPAASNASR